MKAYMIDLPYACFWIECSEGRVVKAPPIARWMLGVKSSEIRRWVLVKGGTFTEIADE